MVKICSTTRVTECIDSEQKQADYICLDWKACEKLHS